MKGRGRQTPTRYAATCVAAYSLLFWSKPELLQNAQIVVCFPLLDYLAVLEAVYGDASELHLLASGSAKLFCLSLVAASDGVAAYSLVPRGYHIFNDDVDVG